MNLVIITTPNEELKETGFGGDKACENVLDSIKNSGHNVKLTACRNRKDLEAIVNRQPDLVILAVKYIEIKDGSNIWLSEFFAANNINFTGSKRKTLDFDSNKALAKSHLQLKGLRTARFFIAIPEQFGTEVELPLTFPLFLKPLDAANGNGIDDSSLVRNFQEYENKVKSLHAKFGRAILAEEYLAGREFTVAIVKTEGHELIVAPIEIIPPLSEAGLRILGESVKKADTETLKKIEAGELRDNVRKIAIAAFNQLGVRDFARIDVKTDKSGFCYFMEANLVPGMTGKSSYFPRAFEIEYSFSYHKVIQLMLNSGLGRVETEIPAGKAYNFQKLMEAAT